MLEPTASETWTEMLERPEYMQAYWASSCHRGSWDSAAAVGTA